MVVTRSVKITFKGNTRRVDVPAPATLVGLQAAVASSFEVNLPPRDSPEGAGEDLTFTYKDADGDDIVFEKDSELNLALRICPATLEMSATCKQDATSVHAPERIYRVAARNLRDKHNVTSMNAVKLKKTLKLLQLAPRRLVAKGLAPKRLLPGGKVSSGNSDERAEASEVKEEKKGGLARTFDDGFVSPVKHEDACTADVCPQPDQEGKTKMTTIRSALLAAGVRLPPCQITSFLQALGVKRCRFVRLGLITREERTGTGDDVGQPRVSGPRERGGRPCGRSRGDRGNRVARVRACPPGDRPRMRVDRQGGLKHSGATADAPPPPPAAGAQQRT